MESFPSQVPEVSLTSACSLTLREDHWNLVEGGSLSRGSFGPLRMLIVYGVVHFLLLIGVDRDFSFTEDGTKRHCDEVEVASSMTDTFTTTFT